MITKFKIFENNKPDYPDVLLVPFINWFYDNYGDRMEDEGWLILYASGLDMPFDSAVLYSNTVGDFWQVQRNDDSDLIENDIEAVKLAKKSGLILDNYGIIIGYNGVSFLEHPEELEIYKNVKTYNL
jgi:hypothetical protein